MGLGRHKTAASLLLLRRDRSLATAVDSIIRFRQRCERVQIASLTASKAPQPLLLLTLLLLLLVLRIGRGMTRCSRCCTAVLAAMPWLLTLPSFYSREQQ